MKTAWLIEHPTPGLGLVYAPEKGGWLTMNPFEAKRFNTKEEAEAFMKKPDHVSYGAGWSAVEHGFDED